ncbi:MAG: hypothetical protein CM15mP3_03990 [Candidatus Poseidoniales archaeon]|nr:MAG: hypothetical protein CM15mP3_03990 [Candidatus Poseidoniales archaeon]
MQKTYHYQSFPRTTIDEIGELLVEACWGNNAEMIALWDGGDFAGLRIPINVNSGLTSIMVLFGWQKTNPQIWAPTQLTPLKEVSLRPAGPNLRGKSRFSDCCTANG